ncbi:hypothetical protein [Halarchaeum acidiphilum]|uniref:hypothetical protein n=1 Tax=Halarchaeum acidiphilum TaxID=489138 RepID=UPI0011D24C11|nr:hypothetical protein [Halarchaeum acidiphilum]
MGQGGAVGQGGGARNGSVRCDAGGRVLAGVGRPGGMVPWSRVPGVGTLAIAHEGMLASRLTG